MYRAAILNLLLALPIPAARPSNPAGVLSELTIANFASSGQTTIQAVATDASGNLYVTGTTNSFNFPVKNAAQPVIGEARILRSTDLGATWTRLGLPPADVTVVVPDPVSPQIVFAAGTAGIFKSTDGGQSWTTVYPSSIGALVIDPGNHLRLAAVMGNNVIRSFDGGNTWAPGPHPCPSNCSTALVVDPSGSGALIIGTLGLSISRDWGTTLQPLSPGPIGNPTTAAFDPHNPGWIYVNSAQGANGALSLSKDFGVTWTTLPSIAPYFSDILTLQVDPDQPGVVIAATATGFYKSSDGGNSWTLQPRAAQFNPETFDPFALVSRKCSPTGGMFAIGSSVGPTYHIDFSPDDGITWNTPQLSGITSVTVGPNCAAYVTRPISTDAFVAKLSPDGTVQWATYLGGSDQDAPVALAVDAQGNAYVTGNTTSPDFPSTVPLIGVAGQSAVFVTKFSPDGTIAFSALLSGEGANTALAMALDHSGSVYIVGRTNSAGFPLTPGALFNTNGGITGYLTKLSTNATLVYSTFLGTLYTVAQAILVDSNNQVIVAGTGAAPGLPVPPSNVSAPSFVVKLNQTATQAVSGVYLSNGNPGPIASAMAMDASGNILIYGIAPNAYAATAGAYSSPTPIGFCSQYFLTTSPAFLLKLDGSTFQTIYGVALNSPCEFTTGAMAIDSSGAPILAMTSGGGLALRSPIVAGPNCSYSSSAIVKLTADGSQLQYATFLDTCGVPAIALAPNGSIFAGAAAKVLNFNLTNPPFTIDQIANSFSGDPSAVTVGGLYTITGTGLPAVAKVTYPLNPSQKLPTQIEGVEVLFDGQPAQLLEVSPSRIIVVTPEGLVRPQRGTTPPKLTSVRISYNGSSSSPVWMPVAASLPGLLTTDQFDVAAHTNGPDGYVQNQDGTLNSASNPAAKGSTITMFVTGMGAPGTPVYASWRSAFPGAPGAPETVIPIPGFIPAILQIPLQVPLTAATGRGTVGLQFQLVLADIPIASNLIGIYVK